MTYLKHLSKIQAIWATFDGQAFCWEHLVRQLINTSLWSPNDASISSTSNVAIKRYTSISISRTTRPLPIIIPFQPFMRLSFTTFSDSLNRFQQWYAYFTSKAITNSSASLPHDGEGGGGGSNRSLREFRSMDFHSFDKTQYGTVVSPHHFLVYIYLSNSFNSPWGSPWRGKHLWIRIPSGSFSDSPIYRLRGSPTHHFLKFHWWIINLQAKFLFYNLLSMLK